MATVQRNTNGSSGSRGGRRVAIRLMTPVVRKQLIKQWTFIRDQVLLQRTAKYGPQPPGYPCGPFVSWHIKQKPFGQALREVNRIIINLRENYR